MSEQLPRPLWSFFPALSVVALGLNWGWEMAQMPAYAEMAGRSWRETALPCLVASLGDVALTFAVYGIGALAAGRWHWALAGGWNVYLTAALLGSACAIAVEWRMLAVGWWSYTEQMPVVPVVDVGLWPLLHLTLLIPVSWWCAARSVGSR